MLFSLKPFFRCRNAWVTLTLLAPVSAFAQMKFSYAVPEGFSMAEMDESASYVATYGGRTLPDVIYYSTTEERLTFDSQRYADNGISTQEIAILQKILGRVDYKRCRNGCDLTLDGYHLTMDKMKRSIAIRDAKSDYIEPSTTWGIVNNQSLDIRASSENYRALNLNGNTWLGMPGRAFGYMNWYATRTRNHGRSTSDQDISSYYLQKNFSQTYLRAGKQNSIDYASGSVSTMLSPSFDKFVTFGSQNHLQAERSNVGSLVMFSTAEGNYEFYRNGRLLLKRPAALGRNEISFADLPGGYYPVEVRLVDRDGNLVSQETREINNLNFAGGDAWHVTAGEDMDEGGHLLEGGVSHNFKQFLLNATAISGNEGRWATEVNVTRPMPIGNANINPTVGVLSGERTTGAYVNLSANHETLGNFTASRYQNNNVSRFYWGAPSTNLSYSRNVRGVTMSYNYQKYTRGESQQLEARWNYRPNGFWSTFAVGIQKGGYQQGEGKYGVYFNMTWTLDRSQASFTAARSGGETQLSGDLRKDYEDTYGTTTAGVTVNHLSSTNSVNVYGSRSGTRGEASLNIGHSKDSTNADFNYRGMIAANADGIALGRYSNSGTAMLLTTPELGSTGYGFNVEGYPVGSNSTYAVPVNSYNDLSFARVVTGNEGLDMNVEVPANILRAHPGQVYQAKAKVDINMIYSGFLVDTEGAPLDGVIIETGDRVYPNGLFSIFSKTILEKVSVQHMGRKYTCDLKQNTNSYYHCI